MTELILKRFDKPDYRRQFSKGDFEVLQLGGITVGRATYQPGWRWSTDVGAGSGAEWCPVEHVGMVVSGRAAVAMTDGTTIIMQSGDVFHIAPDHDSWVVGDEPYVSLHFVGAETYAAPGHDKKG